jgi:ribosome-binding factor A
MSTGRMRRVDEAIRQVLGDAVAGDLKDPRVGFVTVTDVRTSPDLRHARVYVSVLGADGGSSQPDERELTLDGLRSAHGFLQARVASELRLKRTPALEFIYDDTADRALRVEELIAAAPAASAEPESDSLDPEPDSPELAPDPQGNGEEVGEL